MSKLQRSSIVGLSLSKIVELALAEDIGPGDLTSQIFAHETRPRRAIFLAKQAGVLSGSEVVREVFHQLDPSSRVRMRIRDGQEFRAGDELLEVRANLVALLSGERTALNFLQRLSGIATLTRAYVNALGPKSSIGIYDTRKTTPLLRALEKKAVCDGGGRNHRFGLFDMVMLKNNHIDAAGSVSAAVAELVARGVFAASPRPALCIEARNLDEALEAVSAGADIVMLDNLDLKSIRSIVKKMEAFAHQLGCRLPEIEVSGGVTIEDVKRLRRLPIQRISVGRLTHSAPAIDISMRIVR
ncbi:MAG: carboxylating nicotinate-nucleotide diphosphorylase [Candidatus Hydrogenedentota bacterium]|uniref:Probable nicotinate-nucleotide pyrophosphorylase [carboxylating] n=1 Tax=Sumerlaea chitinivorans TaxID=2250252 RepID=A0A2Z4Y4N5_SUMC1|nr:Quinolinate phosphoribosyltransferase [decarboxylating] [Candidatus Sumerlaea chitinivorans]RMH28842.1 MAG: carboxylating nicotinate-nucleotide diphosphorylase [Candidatus Hydrogenedentota bacterium]GIX44096.1 MAG: nicotinate-nucleotide diphosphorylase (carboxylating) [Candidatus Sumerlaea sp.]